MRLSSQCLRRLFAGLIITIGLFNPCYGKASEWKNSEYFLFPVKADDIPTVHVGDTVHLKWASLYSQAYLQQYCNGTAVNKVPGLAGDGEHTFVVNSTWVSPCYWRYYTQESIYKYVESGYVYVTSSQTTPAVTWEPQSLGTACGIQSVTAGPSVNAASTSTITIGPTSGAEETSSDTECTGKEAKKITSGAGVGIGFVVGSAIAGLTAGFWTIWQRQHLKKSTPEVEKPHEADGVPHQPAWELPSESRPVELMTMRRFAELPSTPKPR
ncbi:uncharacterized protein K452DRAFT_360286 [Aplosporella prunicola CBS 121167]|uniref:Uncharacterized protein n=1 Tax=Aplosporella prunicola CBS 121167 TaxID=1176127 RepID=A0A6A6B5S4_9PEZI|nr:uncharacterized protein K452DRAFT_360286 [Aplosporella prunicola CBS 121167]KAF2139482.1 hypothetical protein K452DRAFT_360286 [Aplosporella prunicola CBS 121167]